MLSQAAEQGVERDKPRLGGVPFFWRRQPLGEWRAQPLEGRRGLASGERVSRGFSRETHAEARGSLGRLCRRAQVPARPKETSARRFDEPHLLLVSGRRRVAAGKQGRQAVFVPVVQPTSSRWQQRDRRR